MHITNQVSGTKYQEPGIRNQLSVSKGHPSIGRRHFSIFNFQLPIFLIILLSSCSSTKNYTYFQDIPNDTTLTNLVSKNFEPKIQKGDLLGITVASLSPENTLIYNAPQDLQAASQGAQGQAPAYLVDENGNIQFIKLGTLHVAGMTRKQLKDTLEKELTPYLAETVVAVGFLNRHVTMMGGVSPQILLMAGDNMTLLDALAASGGIGEKGKSDNVMVIREKGNSRVFKRLNLTDKSIFYSPYFYLQPNDIIYVEPLKVKEDKTLRVFTYISSVVSLISILFVLFSRFNL
ncbi:MAG TPA: polysaccharide biosynthesis/export family protein [Hanamia sp.]|nr:polysaccharide biosynthesis/export family protein [Hanamia sp.]